MKQIEAEEILKMGQNVLLTGPAGCGKTFLLNKYIEYLKKNDIDVAITASTGLAATHLDGRTIHSWCGMGLNQTLKETQIKALTEKEHLALRIRYAKVLIIDEISMLNAKRLDLVDKICQIFRKNREPFGGMQVVLCGDFFQLPPVKRRQDEDNRFVTESDIWNRMDITICYLAEQFRQDDQEFLKILGDIRTNKTDSSTLDILRTRYNKPLGGNIKVTKLYTHNANVDAENDFELNKLPGSEVVYEMYFEGVPHLVKGLKESCLAPEKLRLKVDAVVMFVKNNFNKGYVNGTLGKIIGFDEDSGYPVVETIKGDAIIAQPEKWVIEDDGKIIASVTQIPLRLAWAITVHKSQGMTLDRAEIDLSKTFEFGMGYVALSRVRSLRDIKLVGINDLALKVNEEVITLDEKLLAESEKNLQEYASFKKKDVKKRQNEFIRSNKGSGKSTVDDIPF